MPYPLTYQPSNGDEMKKQLSKTKQSYCDSFSHAASTRRSEIKTNKPVGDLCLEIAEFAKSRDYRTLDYLLRMAAVEAYDQTSDPLHSDHPGNNELIGFWDWDVSHNLAYVDPPAAKLFDVRSRASTKGLPLEEYIKAIHPDDVERFTQTLYRVATEGGHLNITYRVINNDSIVWLYAKGSCFIDPGKTPVRFPGALFDITESMTS
jgi:PAS domain-containing protein